MNIRDRLIIFFCIAFISELPASAQWKDVTPAIENTLGGFTKYSPIFLQAGSIKNIKSVNFKNTTYRRGVFSYTLAGTTIRSTYLFDCQEANYKTSDTQNGYWEDMSWITPSSDKNSFEWAAYKYLCPNAEDPWVLIAENVKDLQYYVNKGTGYSFQSPKYGTIKTWVMTTHQIEGHKNTYQSFTYSFDKLFGNDSSGLLQLYVACSTKKIGIYSLSTGPSDKNVILDDSNPNSVGEQMIDSACGK
jgi:hypothetical protein